MISCSCRGATGRGSRSPPRGGGSAAFYPPGPLSGGEGAPGGPGGLVFVNLSSDPLGGVGGLVTVFEGRGVALMIRNQINGSVVPSYTAVVDGEPFSVPRQAVVLEGEPQSANLGTRPQPVLIAGGPGRELDDGPHTLKLLFNADPSINQRLLLYGLFLDGRIYRPETFDKIASLVPVAVPVAPTAALAVPTTPASISVPAVGAQADRKFRYVQRIDFTNTGATPGDAIVFRNAVQAWRGTVPASGSVSYPGQAGAAMAMGDGAFTMQVATGGPSTIFATVWGRP